MSFLNPDIQYTKDVFDGMSKMGSSIINPHDVKSNSDIINKMVSEIRKDEHKFNEEKIITSVSRIIPRGKLAEENPDITYNNTHLRDMYDELSPKVNGTFSQLEIKEEIIIEVPQDIIETAKDILSNHKPLEYLYQSYTLNHVGHNEVFTSLIYAFCAQSSATSKGIQPETTGDKGSGKTHATQSTLYILPQEYVMEGSLSAKALYYNPPKQGSIMYIDEQMSPELVNTVKRMMSSFQRENKHTTVIDGKSVTFAIPKRQVILNSTVFGNGDDQFKDRTIQIGIENNEKDDEIYDEFESKRRMEGRPEWVLTKEVEVCREMMRTIRNHEFIVKIPKIRFSYNSDRRLMNILYDLVEASAILNFMQRKTEINEITNIVTITATQEDLDAALSFEMFRTLKPEASGRLTKKEIALNNILQENIKNAQHREFTEQEIVKLYGKSQQAVRKLLYGENGTPLKITGGLLDKCKCYTYNGIDEATRSTSIRCEKVQNTWNNTFAIFDDNVNNG